MSYDLVRAVWDRKDLDASERLVMLSLADHADDHGYSYPSIKRLCERTSLSERTVQGTIKKLVGRGLLTVRYGEGRNGTNAFVVNTPPAAVAPPQDLHPAAVAPRSSCATPPQILHLPPAAVAPKPTRTIIEPTEVISSGEEIVIVAVDDVAEAVAAFNDMAARHGIPRVQKMTDTRRKALRARLKECGGIEGWRLALSKIEASDFLMGRSRDFRCTFDWIINASNFTKLMEGNYDNRSRQDFAANPSGVSSDPTLRAIFAAAGAFKA